MEKEEEEDVKRRQELFCMTLKSCFLTKITKYQNLLRKHVHVLNGLDLGTQPTEDEIELVLSMTNVSLKPRFSIRKLGRQLRSARLFNWILLQIQRMKARQILAHLNDVSDAVLRTTILEVAWEVAISFEYQLMSLCGDNEVIKLAQHAVSCLLVYLKQQDASFTASCLLQAIIEVKSKCSMRKEIIRTQPVLWNKEPVCLKWRLGHIFKQPGLRIMTAGDSRDTNHDTSSLPSIDAPDERDTKQQQRQTADTDLRKKHRVPLQEEGVIDGYKFESVFAPSTSAEYLGDVNGSQPQLIELQNVSSAILGHYSLDSESENNEVRKDHRRISAIDMNFEEGVMRINDHTVQSDWDISPVSQQEVNEEVEYKSHIMNDREEEDESTYKHIAGNWKKHDLFTGQHNDEPTHDISDCPLKGDKKKYSHDTHHKDVALFMKLNIDVKNHAEDLVDGSNRANYTKRAENERNEISQTNSNTGMPKLESSNIERQYKFYGCFTPFGAKCQPSIYGFRGPLHIWDHNENKYTLIYNDRVTVNERHCKEINDADCLHQAYQPKTWCLH